jgi:hypothetical protein
VITTGPSKILTLIIPHLTKNNHLGLSGVNRKMKMKALMILLRQRRAMHLTGLHLLGVFLWWHQKKIKRVRNPKRRRQKINGLKVSSRTMKRVKTRMKGSITSMISFKPRISKKVQMRGKLRATTMRRMNSRTGLRPFKKKIITARLKMKEFLISKNRLLSTNKIK